MKDRIKQLRKTLNLTLTGMGKALGISHAAVSDWEHGRNNVPESVRRQICSLFNVNRDWLETGKGDMFVDAKSPAQLEAEAFGRVALQIFDSLPSGLQSIVGAVALEIVSRNVALAEAANKSAKKKS